MESQLEVNDEVLELLGRLKEALPDLMASETVVWDEVYKDGALSLKTKRLIALGIALRAGCTGCIVRQTMRAVEAGSTREEFLEAISVVLAMSGTTGMSESLRVLKLLDELGKL